MLLKLLFNRQSAIHLLLECHPNLEYIFSLREEFPK